MYIQAISDHLTDIFCVGRTILKPVNGDEATVVLELIEPFLKAYDCFYEAIESDCGQNIKLESGSRPAFEHIATYLHELLEHNYAEMDSKQYRLIKQLLLSIKCTFDGYYLGNDHWAIKIYM